MSTTQANPAPSHPLLGLAVTHLTPLFLEAAGNDPARARAAAHAAIAEFGARSGLDILLAAEVVAFSLAAISTALQSMAQDIPPETRQRLQTQANTLSRTADRARKTLTRFQRPPSAPRQPATAASPRETTDNTAQWAAAFAEVAKDVAASLPNHSAEQRRNAAIQAAGLQQAARALRDSAPPTAPR